MFNNNLDQETTSEESDGVGLKLLQSDDFRSVQCKLCDECDQLRINEKRIVCLCKLGLFNYSANSNRPMNFLNSLNHVAAYINKCRRWVQVMPLNRVRGTVLTQFTITSYNVLAQNLLLNNVYLYEGHSRSDLVWSKRAERIKNELLSLNSDIFCLQEVHLRDFETDILPSLQQRGYQLVHKQRTGLNEDGCSVLFKKNKFQLLDSMHVEFKQPEVSRLLNRDNVALFVKLQPKSSNPSDDENIIVANTHLLFNPKRGDVKLAQLRLLLAKLQRFSYKNTANSSANDSSSYHPIILCGDLNCQPSSPLVNFLKHGHVNLANRKSGDVSGQRDGVDRGHPLTADHLAMNSVDTNCLLADDDDGTSNNTSSCVIKHMFDFKSVYSELDDHNLRLVSTMNVGDHSLVDYIFYLNHPKLILASYLRLMNYRSINKMAPIPNSVLGSDHFALSAKYYLLK